MDDNFRTFDEGLTSGALTAPSGSGLNLDMGALREYVKKNNLTYEELTNEEIKMFIIKDSQRKSS